MHILVVGGNGFLGSAVCKAAVARSWKVTSISTSGKPYASRKGHTPTWANRVEWKQASAFNPESYVNLLPSANAVVHTIGTLFETGKYKDAIRRDESLARILYDSHAQARNPLSKSKGQYETLNRDSALLVLDTYLTATSLSDTIPRAFIYISAEDITRPFVPARYIETKREAEIAIQNRLRDSSSQIRPVFIRPSLMYHAYARPLTSPVAALLELSAKIHEKARPFLPTPAKIIRAIGSLGSQNKEGSILPPVSESLANLLETYPLHVEHVARAVCDAAENNSIRGIVDGRRMLQEHS